MVTYSPAEKPLSGPLKGRSDMNNEDLLSENNHLMKSFIRQSNEKFQPDLREELHMWRRRKTWWDRIRFAQAMVGLVSLGYLVTSVASHVATYPMLDTPPSVGMKLGWLLMAIVVAMSAWVVFVQNPAWKSFVSHQVAMTEATLEAIEKGEFWVWARRKYRDEHPEIDQFLETL